MTFQEYAAGRPRTIPEPDLIVTIAEHRPISGMGSIKFDTWLDGEPLVIEAAVPMYDSCRELLRRGLTGRVVFVDAKTGTQRMSMDVEHGAKLTIDEGPDGPRVRRYRPTRAVGVSTSSRLPPAEGNPSPDTVPGSGGEAR
jgi:hypothetical protein